MDTQVKITRIEAPELRLLLGAATAGSRWLAIQTTKEQREAVGVNEYPFDSPADCWVDVLLKGGKVTAYDTEADGDLRGQIEEKRVDGSGEAVYILGLGDIIRGLEAAANGTYTGATAGNLEGGEAFSSLYFQDFTDAPAATVEADVLLQIILFNEIVY